MLAVLASVILGRHLRRAGLDHEGRRRRGRLRRRRRQRGARARRGIRPGRGRGAAASRRGRRDRGARGIRTARHHRDRTRLDARRRWCSALAVRAHGRAARARRDRSERSPTSWRSASASCSSCRRSPSAARSRSPSSRRSRRASSRSCSRPSPARALLTGKVIGNSVMAIAQIVAIAVLAILGLDRHRAAGAARGARHVGDLVRGVLRGRLRDARGAVRRDGRDGVACGGHRARSRPR